MKKKKNFNPLSSMSAKILLLMAFAVLASLLITVSIAKDFATNRLTTAQKETLSAVAAEKSIAIEQYVADQKNIAKLIKANETIINQGKLYKENNSVSATAQQTIAATLHQYCH